MVPMSDSEVAHSMTSGQPMRCRKCDYPLWNLKARHCPECGTPFRPSEFEYIANSVRFCCPECDQVYYGTAANGQLEPIEFQCVRCDRQLHMDDMLLRPGEGVEERQTSVRRLPWLDRKRDGRIRSWLKTVGMTMVQPQLVMRALPVEASLLGAAWYALLSHLIFILVCTLLPFIACIGMALAAPGAARSVAGGATLLFGGAIFLAGEALFLLIWGVVTHVLLLITGGAGHSIRRTYQALCYSSSAAAVMAMPILGIYPFYFVPMAWWVVSAIIMVMVGHRVHGGRATFATIAWPLSLVTMAVLAYFGLIIWVFASGQAFGGGMPSLTTDAKRMNDAIIQYAHEHDGAGPPHAIMLLNDDQLVGSDFTSMYSPTTSSDIPVNSISLLDYELLTEPQREPASASMVQSLPEDVIAHRLGDFVFTYHGINLLAPPDPRLWIMIEWEDQGLTMPEILEESGKDGGASWPIPSQVAIGMADGTVRIMGAGTFGLNLSVQNDLRAEHGLAPLGDPMLITHDAPLSADQIP
jgi:hypothetical protein